MQSNLCVCVCVAAIVLLQCAAAAAGSLIVSVGKLWQCRARLPAAAAVVHAGQYLLWVTAPVG
jgi:hypothetical protein